MKAIRPRDRIARQVGQGFTLVEMLVVMAILGVLAAAIMPLAETMLVAQKERELRDALWQIRHAIDDYKRAADQKTFSLAEGESGYPPTLKVLEQGVTDTRPQAQGATIYFLRAIPRDPFVDPSLPPEATWRLRSYASPPDKPEAGADVYDVRSLSDGRALDGSYYAQW